MLRVLDVVRAHDSQPLGRPRRREPVRTRAERCADGAGVAAPVRRGRLRGAHATSLSRGGASGKAAPRGPSEVVYVKHGNARRRRRAVLFETAAPTLARDNSSKPSLTG